MTTLDYFNQFWRLNKDVPFTSSDVHLYFYLLSVWNSTGRTDAFVVKTSAIETDTELNKRTILRSRERLKKRGLVNFSQGTTKGKYAHYILHYVTDGVTDSVTDYVTDGVTDGVTDSKEKVSPTPPLKENISEIREKERITKVIPKKDIDLSFCLPSYIPIMEEWLEYKRNRKEMYKTPASIRKCYNNLLTLSDSNPTTAKLIIDQSMANNWAGIFELKHGINQGNHSEKRAANEEVFRQFIADREQRASGMAYEVEKPF
jgi:hypothetical protein